MVELLVGYVVCAVLCTGGLVVALWLYERRLTDDRPFNRTEKVVYRVGIFVDVLYNHLVLTLVFFEPPSHHRETASARFMRHRLNNGYRGAVARLCWRCFIQPAAPQHDVTLQKKFPHED